VHYLRAEKALRETFFSRLKMLFYASAGMPQHVWDALEELAVETIGERIVIGTGLGCTESSPSALFANREDGFSGLLGTPVPGLQLKLAPVNGRMEARYFGKNITPGYWRQPDLTARAFDEEGFYKTGDALRFFDPDDPNAGMLFDGRLAENFKLTTGTWVNVGVLRAELVKAGAPLIQDAVLAGLDREYVSAILFLNAEACRSHAGLSPDAPSAQAFAHTAVAKKIRQTLAALARASTGSANRIARAIIAYDPPDIDVGEITDKGTLNQCITLNHRASLVNQLYAEPKPDCVFEV
jgi:feruloyl-CoA synthase